MNFKHLIAKSILSKTNTKYSLSCTKFLLKTPQNKNKTNQRKKRKEQNKKTDWKKGKVNWTVWILFTSPKSRYIDRKLDQKQTIEFVFQDASILPFNPKTSPLLTTPTPTQTSSSLTPAFLSRFPRSLSSLSLGGKKKSTEKEMANSSLISPNTSGNSDHLLQSPLSSGMHHNALLSSVKNKFTSETTVELRSGFADKNRSSKQSQQPTAPPPPLPMRNFARRSQPPTMAGDGVDGENILADLTASGCKKKGKGSAEIDNKTNNNDKSGKSSSSSSPASSTSAAKVKKRSKAKIKANSDPKISAQMFIQMEREYDKQELIAATGHSIANEPPPLPPRQPGMLEENQNLINNNKCGSSNSRPASNSLETRMNYPLIATATAVRDNISPFPLSNRPNIRQRLQQQQQQSNVSNVINDR